VTIDDRLSFQLYSARKFPPIDAVLGTLAGLGYHNVEPYGGLLADVGALDQAMKRHGLRAPTCHVSFDSLRQDFPGAVAALKRLGTTLVIVPAIHPPARPTSAAGWVAFARELSELRHRLAAEGLRLGWHNHDFEFATVDGTQPMKILLETDPALVWEADIGWIIRAGEDPLSWLTQYRDRIGALHVKDVAPAGEAADEDGWADVGHGKVDWRRLMPALDADILVVEHDNPNDFRRFAERSRSAVAAW
jgi:sugar phosphate isomerase/epimerase